MQIRSSAFEHGGEIPAKYTCDGEDISPPLSFEDVPPEAAYLALIADDPDVPSSVREDNMWDHWVVFNIPSDMTELAEGQEPPGIHGSGTSGDTKYNGPCPPDREHRYFFKLYALDTELDLPEGASKQEVQQAMKEHVIEKAELVGRYARK